MVSVARPHGSCSSATADVSGRSRLCFEWWSAKTEAPARIDAISGAGRSAGPSTSRTPFSSTLRRGADRRRRSRPTHRARASRGKAAKMVHLVDVHLGFVVPLANVCAVGAFGIAAESYEVPTNRRHRLVVHAADARVRPPAQQPLFEQVLVQGVSTCACGRGVGSSAGTCESGFDPAQSARPGEFRRRKVSGRRRDEGRVQPAREVWATASPQVAHHALGDDLESRVARVPRKHPELELKRRHLGNRRCALAPRGVVARTRAQANGAEGQARRSLEREEELGRWLGNGRV